MAREKGTSQFAGTYEVQAGAALDPRLVVDKLSDLTSADTWPTSGTGTGQIVYIYNGMVVSVLHDNAGNPTYGTMYELVDKTKYTSLTEGWKQLNTGNDIICNSITVNGAVTATRFNGYLNGNVTGNLTGNVTGNVTGNLTGSASKFNNESASFYFRKLGKNTDLNSYGDYSNANGIIYINTEDKDSINSPFKYGSVLSLNYEAGSWMLGVSSGDNASLQFRQRWWSTRDGGKDWSSWSTILSSSNYTSYVSKHNHKHTFTGTNGTTSSNGGHTPAGTVGSAGGHTPSGTVNAAGGHTPSGTVKLSGSLEETTGLLTITASFTGTAVSAHTHTFTGTAVAAHTHTFTPSGSISTPTN